MVLLTYQSCPFCTGDLFIAHVSANDIVGQIFSCQAHPEPEYQCSVYLGSSLQAIITNKIYLVQGDGSINNMSTIEYPNTGSEMNVMCINGKECLVSCIFGGR